MTLVAKLALAPLLVAVATLVARRHGPAAGGFVGALPVVAGPIMLIYALEHGAGFAAAAAASALLGLLSLTAFALAYATAAPRVAWPFALAAALAAFGGATLLLLPIEVPVAVAVVLALTAFALAGRRLAPFLAEARPAPAVPGDLAMRMGVTVALVLALTALAGAVGPHTAGLLAPFPIITTVLACFTHAQAGGRAAGALLAGLVPALVSFAAFCATVAASARALGTAGAFAAATAVALCCHALLAIRRADSINVTQASSLP